MKEKNKQFYKPHKRFLRILSVGVAGLALTLPSHAQIGDSIGTSAGASSSSSSGSSSSGPAGGASQGTSAPPSSSQNPYMGSVPEGKATSEVLSITFKDAIDRGLRNNLGILLTS